MACYVFLTCLSKEAAVPLFGSLVAAGYPVSPLQATMDGSLVNYSVNAPEESLGVLITFEIGPTHVAKGKKTVTYSAMTVSELIRDKCRELNITTLSMIVCDLSMGTVVWVTGNAKKIIEKSEEKKEEESK